MAIVNVSAQKGASGPADAQANGLHQDRTGDPAKTAGEGNGNTAPGSPGETPHWASGAKVGVGTALTNASSVWFTLSHGILTEVYYPSIDMAATRDLELLVADGRQFFSAEGRDTDSEVSYPLPGVPVYVLVNTCKRGRYRIEKEVIADPRHSTVLQQIIFAPRQGTLGDYCLCAQVTSRLGNKGADNTAWLGEFKGIPMLFARRQGITLALACSAPWKNRSVGFSGKSDGRQDLSRHKRMTWTYGHADSGNVALTGEIDLGVCEGRFVLALSFGQNDAEAGHRAKASLLQGYAAARAEYVRGWTDWLGNLMPLTHPGQRFQELYQISAMVMRTHASKAFQGAVVASLGVPWGASMGDDDMGYHVVWPRDMCETIGGLLAIRQSEDARRVLFYLNVIQEADGHWPQNAFLDGGAFWKGIQIDETALVILLVSLARRKEALTDEDMKFFWPMVRRAAQFLVQHGPVTAMDRWEEKPGYYVYTMAAEVAALLVAAQLADTQHEPALAAYLRETADSWNDAIDRLVYVRDTELARRAGVDGYYVRFAGPDQIGAAEPAHGSITLPNHAPGEGERKFVDIVGPDTLALVRFGLRDAKDPRIVNTVKVIDMVCKVETPRGPCWHRYTGDGYGEHEGGAPYDGTGIGRAWPLLTGERAHYELAAGNIHEAERLLRAMAAFANESGMLPEQIWDTNDIPEKKLYAGRPSGSAMPLVWAHAEYVKLCRSLHEGGIFDLPQDAFRRYLQDKTHARHVCWRLDQQWREMPRGKILRIELQAPAIIRWSTDNGPRPQEVPTRETGMGMHIADLPSENLTAGPAIVFTLQPDHEAVAEQKTEKFRVVVVDQSN